MICVQHLFDIKCQTNVYRTQLSNCSVCFYKKKLHSNREGEDYFKIKKNYNWFNNGY